MEAGVDISKIDADYQIVKHNGGSVGHVELVTGSYVHI
jgi:hypothetical protein